MSATTRLAAPCGGLLLAAILAAAGGCGDARYRVVLVYPDEEAYQRAAIAHLFVGEGLSCDELARLDSRERVSFDAHSDAPDLGEVEVGPTAFLARVTSADCRVFLEGCAEKEIAPPEEVAIRIYLGATDGAGCGAGERCLGGRCLVADAALGDAAVADAPAADAPTTDAQTADAQTADAQTADAQTADAQMADAQTADAQTADAQTADAQTADAQTADAPTTDAPTTDAATTDAPMTDTPTADTALPDQALPDAYVQPVTVTVEPVYPLHADWNSYVKNDDPAADAFHQDDVDCEAGVDTGGYEACVHGGEKRKVVLPGYSDCAALQIEDDLGLFSWTCRDGGGAGPVELYTEGLAYGRGLADLLTADGGGAFRDNAVRVTRRADGALVASSVPAPWGWNNQIIALPDNSDPATGKVNLDQAGAVYFLQSSRASSGYGITAPRVGLVTLPGATLSYSGRSDFNCHEWNGPENTPHHRCLVAAANDRDFLWIEGSFDAEGGDSDARYGIMLPEIEFSRLHQVELTGVSDTSIAANETYAIELRGYSRNNLFTDLYVHHARARGLFLACCQVSYNRIQRYIATNLSGEAFYFASGSHNTLAEVLAADNAGDPSVFGTFNKLLRAHIDHSWGNGLRITGNYNVAVDVVVSNSEYAGIRGWDTDDAEDYTLVRALTVANGSHGLYTQRGHRATWSHLSSIDNEEYGFLFGIGAVDNAATDHTTNQLLAVNNQRGVNINSTGASGGHRLHDTAVLHSHGGVEIVAHDPGNRFTGQLLMSSASCQASSGSGLVDGTCTATGVDGSSDYGAEASSALLSVPVDATASFVGPVAADSVSQEGPDGTAMASSIAAEDWWLFENAHRAWGKESASPLFALDQAGRCHGSAECRIYDWRLRADDAQLRGLHGTFAPGQPCPASAHGDMVLQDRMQKPYYAGINAVELNEDGIGDEDGQCESGELCANRFLAHAYEMVLDGRGDDDGLCESGEACVFAPNIGYYQGEGAMSAEPCLFESGAVVDVELYGYLQNGAP